MKVSVLSSRTSSQNWRGGGSLFISSREKKTVTIHSDYICTFTPRCFEALPDNVVGRSELYLQVFQAMEHLEQELIDYPDYYGNRRIKVKPKGLPPAIHRQQALSVA